MTLEIILLTRVTEMGAKNTGLIGSKFESNIDLAAQVADSALTALFYLSIFAIFLLILFNQAQAFASQIAIGVLGFAIVWGILDLLENIAR